MGQKISRRVPQSSLPGTLGFFVRSRDNGSGQSSIFLVTCGHILAAYTEWALEDPIICSETSALIATVDRCLHTENDPIDVGIASPVIDPVWVDCVKLEEGLYLNGYRSLQEIRDRWNTDIPFEVRRTGATSGQVVGTIRDVGLVLTTKHPTPSCHYDNLIMIETNDSQPFAQGRDSGGLVYDKEGYAIAMILFGTGEGVTYALPVDLILQRLELDLVCQSLAVV